MSKENIFDLSKIATQTNDIETTPAEVDQESLLIGYEVVVPTEWKFIPYGSYIRYLRKDGTFRKGGIVQGVWANTDKNGNEVVKIDITAGFGPRITKWSITSNNIEKIWIKRSQQQTHMVDLVEIKEDVETLKESMKQIIKELQNMKHEQIRTVGLIKKIYEAKKL